MNLDALHLLASRFAIITDDRVRDLYGNTLAKQLLNKGLRIELLSFPPGEASKTRHTKEKLENVLLEKGFSRDSAIIALGGGVVTDLAGFLAATYCRGVPLIMVPTTLLAMVDASIGGKNGVNVSQGKNMIGTIYMPQQRWIDTKFLKTLPKKEIKNGIVEMIKHGIIADKNYLDWIADNAKKLLALEQKTIEYGVSESYRIKMSIVEEDVLDRGKRKLLNFGHTVGHALETLTNYQLSHGEAVAIGIVEESRLAVERGDISEKTFKKIEQIFTLFDISTTLPAELSFKSLLPAMSMDKKSKLGKPEFVQIKDGKD